MARLTKQMRCAIFLFLSTALWSAAPAGAVKMERVGTQLKNAQRTHRHINFSITESELNEFVAWTLQTERRPGIRRVILQLAPNNSVGLTSLIDLDEVARWRPSLIPVILRPILHGTRDIQMDAHFTADRGGLQFTIDSASIDGLPVPAPVVQKIIEEVAARQPEHYDLKRPLPLPNGVRRVWTRARLLEGEN